MRALVALAVVGLAIMPSVAAAQEVPVVEGARQVTADPDPVRLYPTPTIAVDPSDPLVAAIAVANAGSGGCGVHITRDGGLSWSTTNENLLPEEFDYCVQNINGPYISAAFASDGTLYVGFGGSSLDEGHPRGPVSSLVARIDELGGGHQTFTVAESEPFTYEPSGAPAQEGFEQHRFNSLAVDPGDPDQLYMGWRQGVGGVEFEGPSPRGTYLATSSNGGETWSEPIDLMQTLDGELEGETGWDLPVPVVAPDGTVYAFTKEAEERVPEGEEAPPIRFFMFTSTDQGQTWSGRAINDGAESVTNPSPAVDPTSGDLYLVWEDYSVNELYFMASEDSGETWSTPVNIVDEEARPANQTWPGISVAPNGRVDLAWHDFRNDPFASLGEAAEDDDAVDERYWDVYSTHSDDGGRTWGPNLRVTDRLIDGNVGATFTGGFTGPIGIASTNYAAMITWPDSRAGDPLNSAEDAYFTRVRFSPSPLGSSASGGPDLLWLSLGVGATLVVGGLVLLVGARIRRGSGAGAAGAPAAT